MSTTTGTSRGQWGTRLGFVLAAAGSAVGLGNIWKFPYITGENGGGVFVLIYLVCIALVGLPVMIAEIIVGRGAGQSPVPAFTKLGNGVMLWRLVGWMGVLTGFLLLSYYSVIAGWAVNYSVLAAQNAFAGKDAEGIAAIFSALAGDGNRSVLWHGIFMALACGVVLGGVKRGIEIGARILMPALFLLLLLLFGYALTQEGFGRALEFLFAPHWDKVSGAGSLEALGHSFFTLSLGMGCLITYGSYLSKKTDVVAASVTISLLDTAVALLACMIMFPILFTTGQDPAAGPGLVFKSLPLAFAHMSGGHVLGVCFFVLLVFAALTSAISLLEVVVATFIDQFGMERNKATLLFGVSIFLVGVPSALSGSSAPPGWVLSWQEIFGMNFLSTFDYVVSNWFLPLGGLLVAIFVGWVIPRERVKAEFSEGSRYARFFALWYGLLRYLCPVAISAVFLYSVFR